MATIGTLIYTALKGHRIGQDAFGNVYYEARAERTATGQKKRWVIYKGAAEPSKVPPEWHGWLHYTLDVPPTARNVMHYDWMKAPLPNLTGTKAAYVPSGHVNRGGERAATVADYTAWKP